MRSRLVLQVNVIRDLCDEFGIASEKVAVGVLCDHFADAGEKAKNV